MRKDRRYGGGEPRVYRDRDYSNRRLDEMELIDRERERERESVRKQREYSPRHRGRGGSGGGDGGVYERMRIVDRSPGRGGGEFERPRMRVPQKEEEDRRVGGGDEFQRPRMWGQEEERRVGVGDYLRKPSPRRLRRDYRHSDLGDRGRENDGGLLRSYHGPDRERSDNGRDDGFPRRSSQFDEGLSRVDGWNHPLDEHRKPDGLKGFSDQFNESLSRVSRWNHPLDEHRKPDGLKGSSDQFNEGLSRVDRRNHPLDEHRKSDGLKGSNDVVGGGAGVSSERDYFSRRYSDTYRFAELLDSNPLRMEAGKGTGYSSSYPLDISVPPKSFSISDGGGCGLTSLYPATSLHKGEGHHRHREPYIDKLAGDQPLAREVCKEDNPLRYLKDEYYVGPSTRPEAFATVSSGGFKEEFTTFRQDHQVHSVGVGLSSGMLNNPLGYDGYGENLLTNSPLDPAGRSSDIRSYTRSYLVPTEEKRRSYDYPDVGKSDIDCIAAGSQDIHGGTVGVGVEYSHRNMLRTSNLDPIVDRMDQFSRGEHIRDSRPWDHHSYSRGKSIPNYVDSVGASHMGTHDVDVLGYGDTGLEYEREAYKDYGSDQPRAPRGYGVGCGPWSHHERSDMLTSGEYFDSPSRRLSPGDFSLPEPSRKILKRTSSELPFSSNGRSAVKIYDEGYADELYACDELDPVIVSKKSKLSSSNYEKTGRRNRDVTSGLTSRNLSQSMPSPSSKSSRDIKARLGPRPQYVHVSHPQTKKYRSSVKKRLGPGPQNVHASHPGIKNGTKNYRSSLKKRLGPGP